MFFFFIAHTKHMKKLLGNISLFISAFVPMYVLLIVKLIIQIINNNERFNVLNTTNLVTLLVLICIGIVGLIKNVKFSTEKEIEIFVVDCQNITDQHFFGYFSLFVFFAVPLNLSLVCDFFIYVIILIMIGFVYVNNSLYYINPFLNILGYKFYNVKYKKNGNEKVETLKIFCKNINNLSQKNIKVKIKNENFAFVVKTNKKP